MSPIGQSVWDSQSGQPRPGLINFSITAQKSCNSILAKFTSANGMPVRRKVHSTSGHCHNQAAQSFYLARSVSLQTSSAVRPRSHSTGKQDISPEQTIPDKSSHKHHCRTVSTTCALVQLAGDIRPVCLRSTMTPFVEHSSAAMVALWHSVHHSTRKLRQTDSSSVQALHHGQS